MRSQPLRVLYSPYSEENICFFCNFNYLVLSSCYFPRTDPDFLATSGLIGTCGRLVGVSTSLVPPGVGRSCEAHLQLGLWNSCGWDAHSVDWEVQEVKASRTSSPSHVALIRIT